MRCSAGPFLLLASLCTGAAWAADQDQHRHTGADPKKVGIVKFENSCSPLVQERIGRAMALLHSFSLHMPSHIFTRLGLWKESIASNRNVVSTAQKHRVPGEELTEATIWCSRICSKARTMRRGA